MRPTFQRPRTVGKTTVGSKMASWTAATARLEARADLRTFIGGSPGRDCESLTDCRDGNGPVGLSDSVRGDEQPGRKDGCYASALMLQYLLMIRSIGRVWRPCKQN